MRKGRIIQLVASIFLSFVVLMVATYAWFASLDTANANGFGNQVKKSEDAEIIIDSEVTVNGAKIDLQNYKMLAGDYICSKMTVTSEEVQTINLTVNFESITVHYDPQFYTVLDGDVVELSNNITEPIWNSRMYYYKNSVTKIKKEINKAYFQKFIKPVTAAFQYYLSDVPINYSEKKADFRLLYDVSVEDNPLVSDEVYVMTPDARKIFYLYYYFNPEIYSSIMDTDLGAEVELRNSNPFLNQDLNISLVIKKQNV